MSGLEAHPDSRFLGLLLKLAASALAEPGVFVKVLSRNEERSRFLARAAGKLLPQIRKGYSHWVEFENGSRILFVWPAEGYSADGLREAFADDPYE